MGNSHTYLLNLFRMGKGLGEAPLGHRCNNWPGFRARVNILEQPLLHDLKNRQSKTSWVFCSTSRYSAPTSLKHDGEGQRNRFGRIRCLVTRAAFNSGKADVVTINDPFVDLNNMIYTLRYDSTMVNSMAQSRLRMGNLSSVESPSSPSRSEILPTSNGVRWC